MKLDPRDKCAEFARESYSRDEFSQGESFLSCGARACWLELELAATEQELAATAQGPWPSGAVRAWAGVCSRLSR